MVVLAILLVLAEVLNDMKHNLNHLWRSRSKLLFPRVHIQGKLWLLGVLQGTDTVASFNPFATLSVESERESFIEPPALVSVSKDPFLRFNALNMNE